MRVCRILVWCTCVDQPMWNVFTNAPHAALEHAWARRSTRLLLLVACFGLYLLAAAIGRVMPRSPDMAIILWLPAGVFVAALLLSPWRAWPLLVLVQCLSEMAGNAIWFHNPWHYALLYFAGNAMAAIFAAVTVRSVAGGAFNLSTPRQVLAFVTLGACAGPVWSAGVIAAVDAMRERHEFWQGFRAVWVGDAAGMLVMTPLIVIGVQAWRERAKIALHHVVEAGVVAALLVALSSLSFLQVIGPLYVTLPVLIWASMRFQLAGAAGGLAIMALVGALAQAPDARAAAENLPTPDERAVYIWTFYGVAAVVSLLVAVSASERDRAMRAVRNANAQLESRVAERTARLQAVAGDLERERTRLGIALRAGQLGVYEWNVTKNQVTWSPETYPIFGVDPATFTPTLDSFSELVHPDDLPELWRRTQECLERRSFFSFEYRIRCPDGTERWVINQSRVGVNEAGDLIVTGIAADMTQRRQAEAAIRTSEMRFRALANAMPQLVWVTRPDGVSTYFNERAKLYKGGHAGSEPGAWHPSVHPEDHHHTMQAWKAGQRDGTYECKHRLLMASGEYRWHLCRASKVDAGEGHTWYGTSSDVHDLVLATESAQRFASTLIESEERFRVMADGLSLPVWVHGPTGELEFVNETYCEFFGVSRQEMYGERWRALTHPDDGNAYAQAFEAAMRERASFHGRTRVLRADGEWRWIESWGRPRFARTGAFLGMVGASADVTERVLAEQQLAQHRDQLEQLVAARTKELEDSHRRLRLAERMASLGTLSAGLGHDMANILVPLRMAVTNLQETPLPESAKEDVEVLARSSDYLRSLTTGLRMLAIDPESLSHARSTSLATWWKEAAPICRTVLPRSVHLQAGELGPLPAVAIPPPALTQIVFNLIQNAGDALRDRASGQVHVSAIEREGHVELIVRDDGPGMTPEVRERCMEPFFTTKARTRGTGLGLAIVHQLLERHRAAIRIESEPERGTAFVLVLPVAQAEQTVEVTALVSLQDARASAVTRSLLQARGASVVEQHASLREPAIWVADAGVESERLSDFLAQGERRWVVHMGPRSQTHARTLVVADPRIAHVSDTLAQVWKSIGGET